MTVKIITTSIWRPTLPLPPFWPSVVLSTDLYIAFRIHFNLIVRLLSFHHRPVAINQPAKRTNIISTEYQKKSL